MSLFPIGIRKADEPFPVGIRKAQKAVSQMRDGRVGDRRRGRPRYSYNAGMAGVVGGTGYPTRRAGVIFFYW